jgi:riboflavin synthase
LFTGLVETIGTVRAVRKSAAGAHLAIETSLAGLVPGESVSVDGVCQTVAAVEGTNFSCDVLRETLRVSTFGRIRAGARVNIERSLPAGGRLGGHLVNGHVDGTGRVTAVVKKPLEIRIALAPDLLRYLAPKGSVAVNGVSLTVGPSIRDGRFSVFVIPRTWECTNLQFLKAGSSVNIEIDILAKYVERYLADIRKGGERR